MSPASTAEPGPRRPPGRPRGGRLLANREELLAAALRAIATQGPDVTMEEIAAEASVSKPILYRTIGDRAAIVSVLSEWMVDQIATEISRALEGQSEPRAQFEAAVRGYLTAVHSNRSLFLFVNAGGQPTPELRRLVDRTATLVIELLSASPLLSAEPLAGRTWAYAIVGAFQIVTVMWLGDDYCGPDTLAADLTRLLWPGVERLAQAPP